MQLTPVASATPDGTVRIARPFRWIPERELARVAWMEDLHRDAQEERLSDEAEARWQNQLQRLRNAADAGLEPFEDVPPRISSRQAVFRRIKGKKVVSLYAAMGDAVRGGRSRSHRLKKSRLRLERRG